MAGAHPQEISRLTLASVSPKPTLRLVFVLAAGVFAFAGSPFVPAAAAQAAQVSQPAASTPAETWPQSWRRMFDGHSLAGWAASGFEGEGAVKVERPFRGGGGAILLEKGTTLSGITWTRGAALPRVNYEISLEATRLEGDDFFCALTFPVGKAACTFVVGGWGGTVVGLSSIDRADASGNETTQHIEFEDNRWYRIRVRVTDERIEAWIDDERKVNVETKGRSFTLRPGDIQKSLPLGIASFMTRAALRDIRLRRL